MARPSKLTPELQQQLVQTFNGGATIKDACAYVGISEALYYRWMAIGRACVDNTDHDMKPKSAAAQKPFIEFVEAITRARAVMRVEAVALIRQAAQGKPKRTQQHRNDDGSVVTIYEYAEVPPDWHAAAWLAERSDPENWGKQGTIRIEGLKELLDLTNKLGLDASDIFQAMITELHELNNTDGS